VFRAGGGGSGWICCTSHDTRHLIGHTVVGGGAQCMAIPRGVRRDDFGAWAHDKCAVPEGGSKGGDAHETQGSGEEAPVSRSTANTLDNLCLEHSPCNDLRHVE